MTDPRRGRALRARAAAAVDLVKGGQLGPLLALNAATKGYATVEFLAGGLADGLLARLASRPLSATELASAHGIAPDRVDGLVAWLQLGESVGLIRERDGRYALRGLAKAVVRPESDAVAAFAEETSQLHHRLISEAPARLREGRPFELSDADSELIARSSAFAEPYITAALAQVVPTTGPVRLVEVGCGSATHIKTAAALNPQLRALGLELQDGAADLARRNLERWGLGGRVDVEVGDVRDREGSGDADLVTLHQNIYYFPEADRVALLRHLGTFLKPGGRLLVTSVCQGAGHEAATLNLWGVLTKGAGPLPTADGLSAQLREAGYADVAVLPIALGGMFSAFVGTKRA